MFLKQSGIGLHARSLPKVLVSSGNTLQSRDFSYTFTTTTRKRSPYNPSRRSHDTPAWPDAADPTPYQIFNLKRDAPYDKGTFYELVKLYHPDRHIHTAHHGISRAAKIERYRLIVAANHILSDPVRRRQYDLYGSGWNGKSGMMSDPREYDREWRTRPGNASMNATWEDWENWYRERNGQKPREKLMSDGTFVFLVLAAASVGSLAHYSYVESQARHIVQLRKERHLAITREMAMAQLDQAPLSGEARIEAFLRRKEGWTPYAPHSR